MIIKAEQKYLLASPRKIREVVELVKRLKPALAVETLAVVGKKAAEPVRKVILAALANAKAKGASETDLVFKEIQVGEGPRLKRGQPISRGQWHPIKKRMSHIRVILMTNSKPQTLNSNEVQKSKSKNQKETNRKETKS